MKKRTKIKSYTTNQYLVLLYRMLLMMLLYSGLRWLFYIFNADYFPNVATDKRLLKMMYGGLKFDLSALLYLNTLYILLYLFPLPLSWKFSGGYQRFLKWLFVIVNTIGISTSCVDLIYFRFIHRRTTYNILKSLQHEDNMLTLWKQFLIDYWYVFLIFFALIATLSVAYSLIKPRRPRYVKNLFAYIETTLMLILATFLSVGGIRGDFRHSTRPINMSNAGKYVESPEEMAIVLNTPFSILRNWGKSNYIHYDFYDNETTLTAIYSPIHKASGKNKKINVVVFILESWNREYIGALNKDLDNGKYQGYTPFLDSLIQYSLVFPNAFANGQKSIEAMPSVIAGLPSLVLPYISSEHASNNINSMPSILKKEGYSSVFVHGAQNGSMGFQSFAKIAGFDKYLGRIEYNNEADFDGIWGIWDEPFFQYYAHELNKMKTPFYATLFSLSSHHPFKVPEHYKDVFPKGQLPIHQCIGYSDNALRQFFNTARKMPWFKNTLFIFTADHSTTSVHTKYKTTMNRFAIPIIFYNPADTSLTGRDERLTQQIDIMPTVLDYIGTSSDYIAFGKSLLKPEKDKFIINYTNDTYQLAIDNYVIYFNGKEIISAFNYKTDPMLQNNIVEKLNKNKYLPLLKAFVQQYNNRMRENRLTIE